MKIVSLVVMAVLLVSCAGGGGSEGIREIPEVTVRNEVNRFIDKEAGVVCWTHFQYGISCLPLSETKLDQ
jgi:hypothetical protein